MGYRLNRLDEPVLIAVSRPLLTEFGIHYVLEGCAPHFSSKNIFLPLPRLLLDFVPAAGAYDTSHDIFERVES